MVFCYFLILYFCTVAFGIQMVYFAEPLFTMFFAPDSIEIFLCMLIMASIFSILSSIILHFIYIWRYDSEIFLTKFYRVHFLVTYFSGAFSLVMASEKVLKEWGFKGIIVNENKKVTYLILFFIAVSNNAFYKAFEKMLTEKLEIIKMKIQVRIEKIKF
ncbi:hypothetical protein P4530_21675 [Bacillus thuringiensis]|nr:hypothetical protein [Bacillus thuringiensis]PFS25379.1 hypothetical protein COK45_04890 [Bacillus thuringiensis]